ncbi:MAG TPA: trypsin-like peptidase domain-containing protein [Gaiellaceae bacterium]|nr:trypsin-like peptidase domain-containing protein [Gaiellaceae bacterium]
MKKFLAVPLVLAALALGVNAAFAHNSRTIQTGIVLVKTNLAYENASAAGTGMVLTSNGEVLTNNHVIRGATTIKVVVPATKKTYTATVVGYDATDDVSVLQLQHASGLATISLGSSSALKVGQAVTAIGNAGGTGVLTTARGSITALAQNITVSDDQGGTESLAGLVQTNANLQPGDSGGPLLNSAGKVIGMDTAASAGFSYVNSTTQGYAIPINKALTLAKQIVGKTSSATVHIGGTAFLGVSVEPAGYFDTNGVVVAGVVANGPVAGAGIVTGDVITAVDGTTVTSSTDLVNVLLGHHPGDKISLTWSDQSGNSQTATVTLASGPPQ